MTRRETIQEKQREHLGGIPPQPLQDETRSDLGDDHPLNDLIGTHEGTVWEQIRENIKRNRKRVNEEYAKEKE